MGTYHTYYLVAGVPLREVFSQPSALKTFLADAKDDGLGLRSQPAFPGLAIVPGHEHAPRRGVDDWEDPWIGQVVWSNYDDLQPPLGGPFQPADLDRAVASVSAKLKPHSHAKARIALLEWLH